MPPLRGAALATAVYEDIELAGEEETSTEMKNVQTTVAGNILTITVDLTKERGLSSPGKTNIIAAAAGNVTAPERDEKIGPNVYRKK